MGVAWRHLSDGPGDRLGSVAGAPGRNIHNKWVIRVTLRRVGCATEREIGDSFTGGAGADWAWWSERSSKPSGARKGLGGRSEEHTSELQSRLHLVCRLLLEKKKSIGA